MAIVHQSRILGRVHVGRHLLRQCGFVVPQSENVHVYLSRRLSHSGNPLREEAGVWLDDLRRDRNRADYDIDQRVMDEVLAVRLGHIAAEVIQRLEDAQQLQVVCDEITQAIRDYERTVLREETWRSPIGP